MGTVAVSLVTPVVGSGTTAVVLLDSATEVEPDGEELISAAELDSGASVNAELVVCKRVETLEPAIEVRRGFVAAVLLEESKLEAELSAAELAVSEVMIALEVTAGLGDTAVTDEELPTSELVTTAPVLETLEELVAEREAGTVAVGSVDSAVDSEIDDAGTAELEAIKLVAVFVEASVIEDAVAAELEASELVVAASVDTGIKLFVDDDIEPISVVERPEATSVDRKLLV